MAVDLKEVKALREETGLGFMDCKRALEESEGDRERAVEILRKKGLSAAERRSHRSAEQGLIGMHVPPDGGGGSLVELRCETDFVARSDDFRKVASDLAEIAAGLSPGETDLEAFLARPSGEGTVGDLVAGLAGRVGEKVVLQKVANLGAAKGKRHRVGGYLHHNGRCASVVRLSFQEEATAGKVDDLLKSLAMHVVAYVPTPLAVSRDDIPEEILEKERAIQSDTDEIKKKPEKIRHKILEGKMQKFIKENALLEQPLVTITEGKTAIAKVLQATGKELSDSLAIEGFLRFQLGEG